MNTDSMEVRKPSIAVQMRLRSDTVDRIEHLQATTGRNRTQVIVDAVLLFEKLIQVQQQGGSILLERPDGKVVQLEFIGVQPA